MKKTIISAIIIATASYANAAITAVTAFEDITLDNGSPNQNTRDHLLVGDNSNAGPYHSLLAFDLSSTITLNPGESLQINSVTFTLNHHSAGANVDGNFTMSVYQYDFDFVPTVSTYAAPAVGDTTAGGTLGTSFGTLSVDGSPASGSVTVPTQAAFESAIGTALTAGSEFRLLITGEDTTDVQYARFKRSDATLNIDYDVVAAPEPSSAALLGLGGIALILRRRK